MVIKSGDIVLISSNGFFANAIKRFTNSEWSHTFIALDDKYLIEAYIKGVRVRKIQEYKGLKYCALRPIVNNDIIKMSSATLLKYAGKLYGYGQIVGFAIVLIIEKLSLGKVKIKNPIRAGVICSELIRAYAKQIGCEPIAKYDKDTISPEDIYQVRHQWKFRIYEGVI